MLINLRKKDSSASLINLTAFADPANDESFCDSTISKRFTRKRNNSNQKARNLRTTKTAEQPLPQGQMSKNQSVNNKANACTVKPEDFFLRITHTPTKGKNGFTPASSDRATESTYLKSRIETERVYMQGGPLRRESFFQLKQELELKTGELMLLEDEVMRLKRDLCNKEQQFLKTTIRKEKEYQAQINKINKEVQQLKIQLQERTAEVKLLKKSEPAFNKQIKALKYDKLVLEKQIEEIYKKRLPKELKQLMSFREISLTKLLEELKIKLEQSKTENENKLQAEVHKLKHENSHHKDMIKRLQVHNRILSRRIVQSEQGLKQKSQAFVKLYNGLKQNNNQLKEQLKNIRKQNLKLKRLQVLHTNHHPHARHKKSPSNLRQSSEQSLNLSLSSNN